MGETDQGKTIRYRAFISYNHNDAVFARRLHRRLEGYRLPGRLVGRSAPRGPTPARLTPIFRDRDELSAAGDLSAEVRAALAVSESLIVVCSPAGAASPWVAREIELFRGLHPDRPVLAAIARGEPAEAFPAALVRPGADGQPIEPLAADFRPGGDGARQGLLKLVAGVAGVRLDELVQRDAQRRLRNVGAVTVAALAGMLAMGGLAVMAWREREEADRQRAKAEGLVDFMLTDLRGKLKGVGRLDVLSAVSERALRYYADEDLRQLSAASLERRAFVLQAIGEDDADRGDLRGASAQFEEAQRTTGALLAADPNNPDRIFAQAQTAYWLGRVAMQARDYSRARKGWRDYKRFADRLVAIAPENPTYRKEAGFADGDLCTLEFYQVPPDPPAAVRECTSALHQMEAAARRLPPGSGIARDLTNRHAWLGDAYRMNRQPDQARAERLAEQRILDVLISEHPKDLDLKRQWVAMQISFAEMDSEAGHRSEARTRLLRAKSVNDEMTAFDPTNHNWRDQRGYIQTDLKKNPPS